jgi:hypothetical protein
VILVDTSVWIDLLRGDASPEARRLARALEDNEDICICGLIWTWIYHPTLGFLNQFLERIGLGPDDCYPIIFPFTHVGGLTAAKEATLHLPDIPGGKKLIYTQIDFPLTAIADLAEKGKTDPLCRRLGDAGFF